jgi:SAM-dependent methyltransferase
MSKYSYKTHISTPLCEIMGKYGSDKGSKDITRSWHNYTTFYYSIFNDIRDRKLRVFELGLGTNNVNLPSNMGADGKPGASLYGWAEYFPLATVYGADIDRDILFNTDRIYTYYCDQTDPVVIANMWQEPGLSENFDIIIEDGLHTYTANVCFFENSIHKLNPGGYFIIEDIGANEHNLFYGKIKEWEVKYPDCKFDLITLPSVKNRWDNTLLVINRQQQRKD